MGDGGIKKKIEGKKSRDIERPQKRKKGNERQERKE